MAIPEEARLSDDDAAKLKSTVESRLTYGKRFWAPLHARMDYWAAMYFLLDVVQQLKPVGYRRFISNDPRTALDAAVSILTRNEAFWRIPLHQVAGENTDEQAAIGKIERTLQGIVYDIDELFSMRDLMPLWKQVAFQGLLRGHIWGKFHVTTEALKYRNAPIVPEVYDARLVYPYQDSQGLSYIAIEKPTTVGELVSLYPDQFGKLEKNNKDYDPNAPALKVEYWSNDRGSEKGVTGTLGMQVPAGGVWNPTTNPSLGASEWIIPPYRHGFSPQQFPVVGVPVNGANIVAKPAVSNLILSKAQERSRVMGLQEYGNAWQMSGASWVAESGRSLLSTVEEQVPQYNELIATIFQHFSIGTYGTWIHKTPSGELLDFTPGIESHVAIRPEEDIRRAEIQPISADAYKLVQILDDERQKGVLSNILQAVVPFQGSGILFQQIANAALNAVEPYNDGMENFGTRMGTAILAQFQASTDVLQKFEVAAPASASIQRRQTFFTIEFDPRVDLTQGRFYRPRPVFKPSLPDDLMIRIQAARYALDPKRPILSLKTVLENLLQIDDPAEEIDRMWEDMANSDPVIVLEQIAMALDKRGEHELAERIRNNEFQAATIQELNFRKATGQMEGYGGATDAMGGGGAMPAETGSPVATQHPGTGQGGAARTTGAAAPGPGALGALGERRGV